jgi:hypothetical protein
MRGGLVKHVNDPDLRRFGGVPRTFLFGLLPRSRWDGLRVGGVQLERPEPVRTERARTNELDADERRPRMPG